MIVIATISILTAIAAPQGNKMLASYRLKATARQLFSTLYLSRARAIKENKTSIIIFQPANDEYTIFFDDGSAGNNWTPDNDDTIIANGKTEKGVDLFDTDIPFNTYAYNSRGLPDKAIPSDIYPAYVRFTDARGVWYAIELTPAGSAKVVSSTDGVTWF